MKRQTVLVILGWIVLLAAGGCSPKSSDDIAPAQNADSQRQVNDTKGHHSLDEANQNAAVADQALGRERQDQAKAEKDIAAAQAAVAAAKKNKSNPQKVRAAKLAMALVDKDSAQLDKDDKQMQAAVTRADASASTATNALSKAEVKH